MKIKAGEYIHIFEYPDRIVETGNISIPESEGNITGQYYNYSIVELETRFHYAISFNYAVKNPVKILLPLIHKT